MKFAIDAGHGPNTPGKRSVDGSLREFTFTSAVADMIINLLQEYRDVEILRTYSRDVDTPLKDRTNNANAWKANCFVSIHGNAAGDGTAWNPASGIETHIYTSKPKEALDLAILVQKELLRNTHRTNRGVKYSDFHVLRETNMTAILCECGFYTNKEECELMKNEGYQKLCAAAIVKGLEIKYKLSKNKLSTYEVTGEITKMSKLAEELSGRGFEIHIKE
jgi:N-acetylmuramoyl-L-alanine amidase